MTIDVATVDQAPPQDTLVGRRSFLARAAALAAVATGGPVILPRVAYAAPPAIGVTRVPESAYSIPRPEALADITDLTVAEAAWLIRAGQLSPETLVEAYLDRIGAYEDTLQAFNLVLAEQALTTARSLKGVRPQGPLHGIPLGIKDNYYVRGLPTTANSYLFQNFVPPFDATAVRRLTAAGGVVLGKTQMGPLATTRATTPNGILTTVNAWTPTDITTNPGGSSTGTATAVAGRLLTSGIGTQTGGSITGPSNAQNLTGIKPTMGRISLYGIIPLTYTRDHPGPMARDAKDAAIMLQAMAGEDPNDPRTQGLPPVPDLITAATPVRRGNRLEARWRTRIGVLPGYAAGDSVTAQARRAFLDVLAGTPGITVVDVTLPPEWELLTGSFNAVRLPERTEPFMPQLRTDLRSFGVSLTSWLQGALMGGTEFITGQRAKVLLLERILEGMLTTADVVVQTSAVPFDIVGLPELALPIGVTAAGVPLGTIVGGLPFAEDRLLAVAAVYQAQTDWHLRRPVDPPGEKPPVTGVNAGPGRKPFKGRASGRSGPAGAQASRGRIDAEQAAEQSQ